MAVGKEPHNNLAVEEVGPQIPWAVLSTKHCRQERLSIEAAPEAEDTPGVPRLAIRASKQDARGHQQTFAATGGRRQGRILRERCL